MATPTHVPICPVKARMCLWEANPIISLSPAAPRPHGGALTVLAAAGAGGTCALIPGPVRGANGAPQGNHTELVDTETGRYLH